MNTELSVRVLDQFCRCIGNGDDVARPAHRLLLPGAHHALTPATDDMAGTQPRDRLGELAQLKREGVDHISEGMPTQPTQPSQSTQTESVQVSRCASTLIGMADDLVTTAVAAKELKISTRTLVRYAEKGYVTPAEVLPSGHRRWNIEDTRRQIRAAKRS